MPRGLGKRRDVVCLGGVEKHRFGDGSIKRAAGVDQPTLGTGKVGYEGTGPLHTSPCKKTMHEGV